MAAIAGKDRRGLAEIVAISGMMLAVAGVLITQLATRREASPELIALLIGLGVLITGRGVQSAMERGASSEVRNHEAAELRAAADRFEKGIDRLDAMADDMRRTATENQRHSMEIIERLMTTATRPSRGD
jgi:hypothetical protein